MPDVGDDDERHRLVEHARVAEGLAARVLHGLRPLRCIALGGAQPRAGGRALLRLQDEGAALVQIDEADGGLFLVGQRDAAFEYVLVFSLAAGGLRRVDAQRGAEVVEEALRVGLLRRLGVLPPLDEFFDGHRRGRYRRAQEIVEHEVDAASSRVAARDLAHRLRKGAPGAVGSRVGQPAAGERLDDAEDVGGAASHVFVIGARDLPGRQRNTRPCRVVKHDRPLVDADDGLARVKWTRVHLEHVLHPIDELRVDRRYAPHFVPATA